MIAGTRIQRKILVSSTLGVLTYLIAALTQREAIWSITLSVFIAGVAMVVQSLIEFETRLAQVEATEERHSAKVEQAVEEGFAKINTATELFGMVESSALPTDSVLQLVRHATLIRSGSAGSGLVVELAQQEIRRLSTFLRLLSESETVSYEGEDRDWLLTLTRRATSSIDATSLTTVDAHGKGYTDQGFWATDLGRRYLEAQHDAVRQRDVKIRRLFILIHPDATDTGLVDVGRLHKELGVEVRVLGADAIPASVSDVDDFVVFDNAISYRTTVVSRLAYRPSMLNTHLELRQDTVKARVNTFEVLWQSARPLN
jgi:hypothetical protein